MRNCPSCGREHADSAAFCAGCGTRFDGAAPAPVPSGGYDAPPSASPSGGGKALASLIIGIASLLAWCLPCVGIPLSITGLVLGILDLKSPKRGMAIAGIALCSLGLLVSLVNAALGAYMGATGQLFK